MVTYWNRSPKEAVGAPSLEAFKPRLDVALGSPLQWLATAHSRVLNNWIIIVVLFNPGYSMILWFYDCISMEVLDIEHVFLSAMLIFLWHD